MNVRFRYLLLPIVLLFSACKDDPEQIPAYLHLEHFIVNEPGGAAWHKITDGWVYVNGEFLGAYTLPATIPILAEGETKIIVFPGVKENGVPETPNLYDFLLRSEHTVTLTPAQTTNIQPITKYKPEAIFAWLPVERSTFDNNSNLILESRDTDTGSDFELTTDGAFSGRSVKMAVDTSHPIIEIATEQADLPIDGNKQVWLELNYRNDMPFFLYLIGQTGTAAESNFPVYRFNESETWNKTYINLTQFMVQSGEAKHRLLFQVGLPRDSNTHYSQNSGTVYLDNIKIVHF